jgi:acetyl-CoA carboxylase biotin carboxyl carrier protein
MGLSDEDVREILRIVDQSELAELRIETDGFSLHVRRDAGAPLEPAAAAAPPAASPPPASPPAERPPAERPPAERPRFEPPPSEPSQAPAEPPPARDGAGSIDAPMLGTFYRADAPGAEPFVAAGARVEPDTTVCIIEVMKMMNAIQAGVAGVIAEVCAENGQLVEYGQPLFRVEAA